MKKRKKQRPHEIRRYHMGIHVSAGGRAFPTAHMIYEVIYSDGSARHERGRSIHGVQTTADLNAHTKQEKEEARLTSRTDLFTHIHAAKLLLQDIEHACLLADDQLTPKRSNKKRYKDDY